MRGGRARRTSKSTVARICSELHERFEAFCRRDLYETRLVVLFLDAIYLPVRPSGPKEGVMCAWGFTENGERALVSVRLGAREAKDDWLELGRDLVTRGLQAPRLVVADGAPGLTWPSRSCGRAPIVSTAPFTACATSTPSCPSQDHDRVRLAYWKALNEATGVNDGKLRLQVLISELTHSGDESAARCLTDDLDAFGRAPARPAQTPRTDGDQRTCSTVTRRGPPAHQSHRPVPRRDGCLTLVWAVLDLFFSHASNGATFTDLDRQHLYRIKYPPAESALPATQALHADAS